MTSSRFRAVPPLLLAVLLTGCGGHAAKEDSGEKTEAAGEAKGESGKKADTVKLSADQIRTAGIEIVHPTVGGNGGAIELPATVEGSPQGTQIVSAAIAGRVVALNRNLGEAVRRGETLAVIESREAASLKGEVEAARARLALAQSNYAREQRLYAERVSPEQDLIAARTAATEASIALRLARQQLPPPAAAVDHSTASASSRRSPARSLAGTPCSARPWRRCRTVPRRQSVDRFPLAVAVTDGRKPGATGRGYRGDGTGADGAGPRHLRLARARPADAARSRRGDHRQSSR